MREWIEQITSPFSNQDPTICETSTDKSAQTKMAKSVAEMCMYMQMGEWLNMLKYN